MTNDVVRFVFYEPVTWRQERKKGQRQTKREQGIGMLPVRRWWAGRGRQEDHQQGWETGEGEGQVGKQEKGRRVPPGRPAPVPGTDPILNKLSHHRKAFYNFLTAVLLAG